MQTFVEAKTREEAEQKIPHHVSKLVKVEGGYTGFEFITDYNIWKRAI
jgi:hypothetical protein